MASENTYRQCASVQHEQRLAACWTSCNRGLLPTGATNAAVRRLSGVRIVAREELTRALADDGLIDVEQRVTGLAQFALGPERP